MTLPEADVDEGRTSLDDDTHPGDELLDDTEARDGHELNAGTEVVDGTDSLEGDEPIDGDELAPVPVTTEPDPQPAPPRPPRPFTPRLVAVVVAVWLVCTIVVVVLVIYGVGPMLQQRDQRDLLSNYREDIEFAANATESFSAPEVETSAPATGEPVGILEIPALQLQQVIVEGVGPQQTRQGPGHVPGTAGPGQPGNSAVVGRRAAFGGSFRQLDSLQQGDEILVTTVQGPSVYRVAEVRTTRLGEGTGTRPAEETTTTTTTTTTTPEGEEAAASEEAAAEAGLAERERAAQELTLPEGGLTTDEIYGPTPDDRITLVTAESPLPWQDEDATVVVAGIVDPAYEPTPQNGRSVEASGRGTDSDIAAPLGLALAAYAVTVVAAVLVYRRARPVSAYLVTAPPLVAATLLTAETVARVMPAWA